MRGLLLASISVVGVLVGCGGKVIVSASDGGLSDSSSTTDSITVLDTAAIDTGVIVEPPVDTGPPVCDTPVSGFTCPSVTPLKGAKVCTDVQIKAFMDGCFGDTATSSSCSAAQKKYPTCNTCVLRTFITETGFLDTGPCMQKVKPTSTCAATTTCLNACWAEACSTCDPTPSGGSSEYNDCIVRQSDPSGSCWAYGAKDYEGCMSDPDLAVCAPRTVDDLLPFFRGGCRDGGDWSKAYTPDGTL